MNVQEWFTYMYHFLCHFFKTLDKNTKDWEKNCSFLTEFIFRGIADKSGIKVILFIMFFVVYLINILANLEKIILIRMDP